MSLRAAAALVMFLTLHGVGFSQPATAQLSRPWMNASLSPDVRAAAVLQQLTLDEKIQLVHGIGWGPLKAGSPIPPDNNGGAGEILGIPRLGIPSLQQADSAVGVRMAAPQSRYATLLPSVLAAAAAWDPQAAHLYGDVIGRELRAQGFNQSIGGGVNLARDPRNGRLFEYAGEDPVLAGVTVGHVIRGVQDNQVMGDIKHFAFNDQETGRTLVDARISPKAARESDLLAFELGIRIGQPSSVMCSYNKVNGDWACENDWLLNHVLKGAWRFPGFVVSDWDGTHSTEKAALAGLDVQMPGDEYFGAALKQAVISGLVPLQRLDDMVHRVLRSMFNAGVIDHPPTPRSVVDPFRGREDAQHIAEESIVLLKNDGTLPLNAAALRSIAVIGAHADVGVLSGGGSAQVDAPGGNAIAPTTPTQWGEAVYFPSSPLRYIRKHAQGALVQFAAGTDVAAAAALAKSADIAIVFADQYMSESGDAPGLSLPGRQDELIAAVAAANPRTIVVLITGNPVTMPWIDRVAGVLEAWYPGIGGGQAIANLLFGTVVPSGKLPITFAKAASDLPHEGIFGVTPGSAGGDSLRFWAADKQTRRSLVADYKEGVRFGYKWFDSEGKQPLFPFGYGLSYTRFKYADLQVDPATKTATFTVENIGARSGTEIAQVYVALPKASGEHFRRLAGWQRVAVPAGQQKVVSVALEPLALATFNVQKDAWAWASGRYTVFVGGSSRDLPLVADAVLEPPAAPSEARVAVDLNHGWRFRQGDGVGGVPSGSFDDSQWSQVDLPHTWNRLGNAGTERSALTNTVQGVGWYRLRFRTPPPSSARRYFLQFDGVGAIADVWLNGHYLGKHAGAFSRFRFDASTAMNPAGDNLLVVKADNSRPQPGSTTENVIPLSADFFVFGGIYRGVALIATDPVHLDMLDFGGPGLYARAVTIDANAAAVRVSARLVNDGSKPRRVLVETRIEGDAQVVASTSTQLSASPGQPVSIDDTLQVARPRLWQGMKDPYLYRVVMTVRAEDGQVLDQVVQPLGLRSLRFDADQGFFLNGEHLFLKGVSMHQDRPVKGWAISRADQAEDFDLLRDMGANAVRLAHYQHDQYSYELADALGVVVWAEIPLVNKVSFDGSAASTALAANARQQLTELIRQNYNHPSIAVWSIGNETDLTATMTGGPSILADLLKSLNALAKSEDPGRFTSYADCCEASVAAQKSSEARGVAPRDAIVGITDTVGYNRYFGWYIGQLDDFGPMLDAAHARHPALPIAVSEYGAGGALTQHTDDPAGGPINPHGRPHPEEFQSWYHEASWKALRDRGYLWAVYIWNLFDFASDSRQEGDLTDVNEKGLISYDRRTRKDAFYFYRANWSSQPTLHLVGRRYLDRAYGVVDVKAYSNAPQATLWLNDRGQGMAPCTGGICLWHSVQLASGTNDLRATADVAGTVLRDSMRWTFAGSLASVRIKAGDISGYLTKAGQRYGSDAYFSGGVPGSINPPDTRAAARIAVAADDPGIYDSFREGAFAYRVPVPSGRYRVTLKFEEPSAGTAGAREFNVLANGKVVLKRFDIFAAAGGALKGVDRVFDSTSRDNTLLIEFVPVKGAALVSALAIEPLDRH